MNDYQDFSSWRPDQERQFVVFERTSQENAKKAFTTGIVAAVASFVVILATVFSFDKPKPMDSDQPADDLGAETEAPAAAAPTPAPAAPAVPADPATTGAAPADPAAAAAAPSDAPADPAAVPAAGATVPPPPPKGMTKAPPTALIK